MKFFSKRKLDNVAYFNPQIEYREPLSLSTSKEEIIYKMAENVKEAKKIIKKFIVKDLYWASLVSSLDDMNIRGKQIKYLWLASQENTDKFLFNIEHPQQHIIDAVNIYSALNENSTKLNKAFLSGATHIRQQNSKNSILFISNKEANDLINNSIKRYDIYEL